jgi:hypothetical protein
MRSNKQARSVEQNIMKTQRDESKEQRVVRLNVLFHKFSLALLFFLLALSSSLFAEIRDRVVAFVDNDAITLSELEEQYNNTIQITPDITKEEVLNTMVNRLLLLREARKIKLEALTEDALLKEYIDLKIRAFIRVKEEDVVDFYEKHIDDFQENELETVREEIENVLLEKALNERLKSHINELKKKACVKIQLYE